MNAAKAEYERLVPLSDLPQHVPVQCDPAPSSTTVETLFDEETYASLRKRFLEEGVYMNEELPMGRVLRQKVLPPLIDSDQPGFKQLKSKIKELE